MLWKVEVFKYNLKNNNISKFSLYNSFIFNKAYFNYNNI